MNPASISIVVPTLNGIATLPAALDAIARQRRTAPVEIVAVDSGSTDGTRELLERRGVRLVHVAPEAFDHGLTRNLGITEARGELVVLIVQDAVPATEDWLAALTRPLADPRIAGAFARQVPRDDASALTRHYLARWLGASMTPRTAAITDEAELAALDPLARLDRCTFDNVCSCIRRSIWQRHPFRATPIGEDLEWARTVLLAGYRLAYVPEAVVIHSHDRSARYEFDRTRILHRRLYELFEVRTIPTLPALGRAIGSTVVTHLRCDPRAHALALAVAWPLGQYLGALSAARNWKAPSRRNV